MKKPESPPPSNDKFPESSTVKFLIENNYIDELYKIERDSYPYWEGLKYKIKKWNIEPEKVWSFLKYQRRFSKNDFHFSDLPDFTFTISTPRLVQKYLHELDLNLGGNLEGKSLIPSEDKNRYLISSIMEEAIASSQLEGAATTRRVAKDMLEKKREPKNKSEKMILNNYLTMRWIVDNKNTKLTEDTLLSIHRSITNNTLQESISEGKFRDNNNVRVMDETNEVFYIPPSFVHLNRLIQQFCEYANDEEADGEFIHPVIKGIILHFLVGYIHPFTDGNGRTARAIFYWYLAKKGYWLINYMSVSRIILKAPSQYARAYLYTEYDENDLTYFILYNVKALHSAWEELKNYINFKKEERKKTLSLLKSGNYNDRQVVIIKDILQDKEQYFTVKQIEERFGVSNQTARNDLVSLAEKKILAVRQNGNKAQFFATDEVEKVLGI